jgi:uncharacterized protein YebE (UPF0316 family)
MEPITLDGVLFAGLIFILRVTNYAISTLRTVAITRQQRLVSASFAFLEAFVFAAAIGSVVSDLDNILNLFAYCFGASAGSYMGMVLEARFITSYKVVNIIAHDKSLALAEALREQGYGVTVITGEGREGAVSMLRSVVSSREVGDVLRLTRKLDEKAFVAVEEARAIQHGWLRNSSRKRMPGVMG